MKYVMLAGYEDKRHLANIKIISIIAEELSRMGHDVTILLAGAKKKTEVINGVKFITTGHINKNKGFIRKLVDYTILNLCNKAAYPNLDMYSTVCLVNEFKNINRTHDVDCVIGFSKPFMNIATAKLIKQKYSNIACYGYILDLYEPIDGKNIHNRVNIEDYSSRESRYLKALDGFFYPPLGEDQYGHRGGVCVDFPTYMQIISSDMPENPYKDKYLHFLLYGSLDEDYRNPRRLLELAEAVSSGYNIEFDLFCNGCDAILDEYSKKTTCRIKRFNQVPFNELKTYIYYSDVLLNVSNKSKVLVPSKIFELFSTGKPIINFSEDGDNSTASYFSKYPNVLEIHSCDGIDISLSQMCAWLETQDFANRVVLPKDKIKSLYIENTPEYVAEVIEKTCLPV